MKRPYTKQLYELIYKHTRIKPDPQVFLGMVAHAQTVDTRPFFFCERPGYEARDKYMQNAKYEGNYNINSDLNISISGCQTPSTLCSRHELQWNPLNGQPATADTHDIMDNSESPDCPSIHFNTQSTPEQQTPHYSV